MQRKENAGRGQSKIEPYGHVLFFLKSNDSTHHWNVFSFYCFCKELILLLLKTGGVLYACMYGDINMCVYINI